MKGGQEVTNDDVMLPCGGDWLHMVLCDILTSTTHTIMFLPIYVRVLDALDLTIFKGFSYPH